MTIRGAALEFYCTFLEKIIMFKTLELGVYWPKKFSGVI
jgi:hypothetical protein